jgi:hypothetical protein
MRSVYFLSILFAVIFSSCDKTDGVTLEVNELLANSNSYIFEYLNEQIDLFGEEIVKVEFKNNNYTIHTSHSTYEGKYIVLGSDRIKIKDDEWKIIKTRSGAIILKTWTYNPIYQIIRNETQTYFHLYIGTEDYTTEIIDESILLDSQKGSVLGGTNNYDNLAVSFHTGPCEYPEHLGHPVYGSTVYDLRFSVKTENYEKLAVGTYPGDLLSFYAPNEERTGVYAKAVSFSNNVFQWKYNSAQEIYKYETVGKTGEVQLTYFDGVRIKGNFIALLTSCDTLTNHSDKQIQVSGNFSFKDHVAFLNKISLEKK